MGAQKNHHNVTSLEHLNHINYALLSDGLMFINIFARFEIDLITSYYFHLMANLIGRNYHCEAKSEDSK